MGGQRQREVRLQFSVSVTVHFQSPGLLPLGDIRRHRQIVLTTAVSRERGGHADHVGRRV